MHELSIAHSLVEVAQEAARTANAARVTVVHLRLGQLAGIVEDSLRFGWEIATDETLLAGASLVIEDVPILAHCPQCAIDVPIASPQRFCCPYCDGPTPTVVQGREVELMSMEIIDDESVA